MTSKDALIALRDKVEKTEMAFNNFCDHWEKCFAAGSYSNAWKAYNKGSIDAAMALHEAALHRNTSNGSTGWSVELFIDFSDDHVDGPEFKCAIFDGNYHCSAQNEFRACSMVSLARAWLLAILEALIAKETE
jgi:hypothetical protein